MFGGRLYYTAMTIFVLYLYVLCLLIV